MIIKVEPYPAAVSAIEKQLAELGKEDRTHNVLKKAINETAGVGKERIHKETKRLYTIKSSAFKKSDIVKKTTTSRSPGATLTVRGTPTGVKAGYKSRKNGKRKSAQVMILQAGTMKEVTLRENGHVYKAFLARMKSGHVGIFQRVPGERMKSNPAKQAIKEIMSLSQSKAAEMAYEKGEMYTEMQEELIVRLHKHMNAVIDGGSK